MKFQASSISLHAACLVNKAKTVQTHINQGLTRLFLNRLCWCCSAPVALQHYQIDETAMKENRKSNKSQINGTFSGRMLLKGADGLQGFSLQI